MDRIEIENINHPGKTEKVDAAKYEAMKRAMIAVLPPRSPGMTAAELKEAAAPRLPDDLFPGGATAGWWLKAVQLDLEAKGAVVREKVSPLRFHRA